jgi:hypothetical protein
MRQLGIIAEDRSDVEVVRTVLKKISRRPFTVQKFVGHGCGRIMGKCAAWAENLHRSGCTHLVLVQDLDGKDPVELSSKLATALEPGPIQQRIVVLAVQEIEAWLLTDSAAIRSALSLRRPIRRIADPEKIPRPKEYLRDLLFRASGNTLRYVNTIHNSKIADRVSVASLRRCPSFRPLEKFAREHL